MRNLVGRYCYIDTPWIAGKDTRYLIVRSGVKSNAWNEVPFMGESEPVLHDETEEIVFVILDTLIDEASIVRRFALKDVKVDNDDIRREVGAGGPDEAVERMFEQFAEMEPREAIQRIEEFALHHAIKDMPYSAKTVRAFHMAVSALEKLEPKQPVIRTFCAVNAVYCCPECESNLIVSSRFCPNCGQRILWRKS